MTNELRLRREAAQAAYDAARVKDETEEFKFLGMKMSDINPAAAYLDRIGKKDSKKNIICHHANRLV